MKIKLVFILFVLFIFQNPLFSQELLSYLQGLDSVRIEKKESAKGFSDSYILYVTQPIDHSNPKAGSFEQRVFLSHRSFESPVVMVTEGYAADYANNAWFVEELTELLKANQIVVEHRFFSKSTPEGKPWKYLNVRQSAADHHHIVSILKRIYKGKWLSTGSSKGGSTCVYHRCYYPGDMDATVAYVAPFTIKDEDPRTISFLQKVGPDSTRAKVRAFQRAVLSQLDAVRSYLKKDIENKNLTLTMSVDSVLSYMVLEFPFTFYQYGYPASSIPAQNAAPKSLYIYLRSIVPPSTYAVQNQADFGPFYVQAYGEVGYYGYDTTGVGDILPIHSAYISNIVMAPKIEGGYKYNPATLNEVRDFIKNRGNNIIYIYGEYDPWSATAAEPGKNVNAIEIMDPAGSHNVRIAGLNDDQKALVYKTLESWMNVTITK